MIWIAAASILTLVSAVIAVFNWHYSPARKRATPAEPPRSFGYKMAWVAVQTRDTAQLIETMRLKRARSVSWSAGVEAIYGDEIALSDVLVTPPVGDWSFIVGLALPHPMAVGYVDRCTPLLRELSREFGKVHYFVSHPGLAYYGWASLSRGRLLRAFATGADGIIWNRGIITQDERALGGGLFDIREARDCATDRIRVDETYVLGLAERWSIDPTRLDERSDAELGVCYLAKVPAGWRAAERQMQAA